MVRSTAVHVVCSSSDPCTRTGSVSGTKFKFNKVWDYHGKFSAKISRKVYLGFLASVPRIPRYLGTLVFLNLVFLRIPISGSFEIVV